MPCCTFPLDIIIDPTRDDACRTSKHFHDEGRTPIQQTCRQSRLAPTSITSGAVQLATTQRAHCIAPCTRNLQVRHSLLKDPRLLPAPNGNAENRSRQHGPTTQVQSCTYSPHLTKRQQRPGSLTHQIEHRNTSPEPWKQNASGGMVQESELSPSACARQCSRHTVPWRAGGTFFSTTCPRWWSVRGLPQPLAFPPSHHRPRTGDSTPRFPRHRSSPEAARRLGWTLLYHPHWRT